jgi:hypothetical protein
LLLLLLLAGVLFAYRLGWGSLVNEADWVWIGGLAGILGVWLAHAVLSVVGDAATYLYPCPETYQARENIRQAGARLLLELHAAREAGPDPDRASLKYERIIVVGHSLGSLIGYDILQYAFAHRNQYGNIEDILHQPSLRIGGAVPDLRKLGFVTVPDGPELSAVANIGRDLWRQEQDLAGADLVKAFDCRTGIRGIGRRRTGEYRKAQRALFSSLVRQVQAEGETGQRGGTGKTLDWRVSDFVTIGSPLTYAAFLLAPNVLPLKDSPSELENKNLAQRRERPESDWPINGWLERQKAGGVLPTCPPRGYYEDDNKDNKKTPRYFVASVGTHDERSAVLLNSALFALTRWTNLYVPSNGRFLFGDLLSGPLGPVFGLGISDRPLDPMAFSWRWPLRRFAHTRYWSRDPRDGRGNAKGGRPPLDRCSRGCA